MTVKYEIAWGYTSQFEGGLSNDKDDAGGLTYRGISYVKNPGWTGWPLVIAIAKFVGVRSFDELHKKSPLFDKLEKALNASVDLQQRVSDFYEKLWHKLECERLTCQELANEFFDTAVNMGSRRAVLFLQKALNYGNKDQVLWPDVAEDGGFGNEVRKALDDPDVKADCLFLYKVYSLIKGGFYLEIMKKNHKQEKYARGWIKRVWVS